MLRLLMFMFNEEAVTNKMKIKIEIELDTVRDAAEIESLIEIANRIKENVSKENVSDEDVYE
jgi:hypothetical protein